MINVLIFIGSRANYGRLGIMVDQFKNDYNFKVTLVSSYDGISSNYFIELPKKEKDDSSYITKTISKVATDATSILQKNYFDFAIVHGDRFETFGFAIACNAFKIPIVHMESGEITDTDNGTRWAISALSDYHICPTEASALAMTFSNKSDIIRYNAYNYGSTIVDYIKSLNLEPRKFEHVLIVYNPYEATRDIAFIDKLSVQISNFNKIKFKWIVPNLDPGNISIIESINTLNFSNLDILNDVSPKEYIELLNSSIMLVGNSSSGIKEAYYLGVLNLLVEGRQGDREYFSNTEVISLGSFSARLFNLLARFSKEGKYKLTYQGELGDGSTCKKVMKLLIHENGGFNIWKSVT